MMKHRLTTLFALACLFLVGCGEAFRLAPSSRMPVWFSIEDDAPPEQLSVILTYHLRTTSVRLEQPSGRTVLEGTSRCHPDTLTRTNRHGGFDLDSYPHHVIVVIDGVAEVIEHRAMEPLFYVTDDPALTSVLAPYRSVPSERQTDK